MSSFVPVGTQHDALYDVETWLRTCYSPLLLGSEHSARLRAEAIESVIRACTTLQLDDNEERSCREQSRSTDRGTSIRSRADSEYNRTGDSPAILLSLQHYGIHPPRSSTPAAPEFQRVDKSPDLLPATPQVPPNFHRLIRSNPNIFKSTADHGRSSGSRRLSSANGNSALNLLQSSSRQKRNHSGSEADTFSHQASRPKLDEHEPSSGTCLRELCPYWVSDPGSCRRRWCYPTLKSLKEHVQNTHIKITRCNRCGARFGRPYGLSRHQNAARRQCDATFPPMPPGFAQDLLLHASVTQADDWFALFALVLPGEAMPLAPAHKCGRVNCTKETRGPVDNEPEESPGERLPIEDDSTPQDEYLVQTFPLGEDEPPVSPLSTSGDTDGMEEVPTEASAVPMVPAERVQPFDRALDEVEAEPVWREADNHPASGSQMGEETTNGGYNTMPDRISENPGEHFLNNDHMLPASQLLAIPNSSLGQFYPGNFYYYVLAVDGIFYGVDYNCQIIDPNHRTVDFVGGIFFIYLCGVNRRLYRVAGPRSSFSLLPEITPGEF